MALVTMPFTQSTDYKPVRCGTSFTTVHTATALATNADYDEIFLWLTNATNPGVTVSAYVAWGDTSDPGGRILNAYQLPAGASMVLAVPGLRLRNGLIVSVIGINGGNALLASGYVNRYS